MSKLTVVFPMGGEGQRFGNKFKPFLKIFDKTFIELAIDPFLKYKELIKNFVFIVRNDHYAQFKIEEKIKSFNLQIPYSIKQIDKTDCPIKTVDAWLEQEEIEDIIFCDCDHSVDITTIIDSIKLDYDSIIMGYDITIEEVSSWSVVTVVDSIATDILEKQVPQLKDREEIKGVIGCYYFKKYNKNYKKYSFFSDVIRELIREGKKIRVVPCLDAKFFGDPKRLTNLYKEKNASTVFCDIDGTIVKHENIPDYSKKLELLPGARETIDKWRKDENRFIVLTTSRDEQFRPELERLLREANIIYECLIMNLPPGPRFLVNDKKPYSDNPMALAHEVIRDVGIKNLNLGHSIASLKRHKNYIVKSIDKDASEYQKNKFKAQYDSMKKIENSKFSFCVPYLEGFNGYSYTIENMVGYCGLHLVSAEERYVIIEKLLSTLGELYDLTSVSKDWLNIFLNDKIFAKQNVFAALNLEEDFILIQNHIKNILKKKQSHFEPKYISSFIVGDLTLENILTNGDLFKLIDFDNDNKPGIIELDLGKLFQSYLTKYEWWDEDSALQYQEKELNLIIGFYASILKEPKDKIVEKGKFYCAMHLIRMVPYQAQKNVLRAKKAIKYCIELLNDLNF